MQAERSAALAPGITPARRITLDELLIRQWQPEDLRPRWEAITASFDHLRPWWSDSLIELATLDGQRVYGRNAEHWPTTSGDYRYGIFDHHDTVLGGINLQDRLGSGAIELGYWCHVAHTGHGVITRAAAALTELALALPGIDRVEIHCDVNNLRSAAVPRRLGFRLDRTQPREKSAPSDSGTEMCWIRDR
ncbi:GNAT family N-acetyltransferase [Nocardia sp. NPDC051570]|uniref:GNAT family N-acetyltransferase n=1 Tax=Nocardia sp. NPDC051570 TaxID=3364324 RepID=UPI00379418BB